MFTIVPFPAPDQTVCPFVPPAGALQNGAPVAPGNVTLYATDAAAKALLAQYKQAACLQRLACSLTIVDGTLDREYGQFTDGTNGKILIIRGTVTDANQVKSTVSDVVGDLVERVAFPFSPGKESYGDTNYKVVDPVNSNGQLDAANALDEALPAYLALKLDAGQARGVWVKA